MKKRVLSALLALALVCSSIPVQVFATGGEAAPQQPAAFSEPAPAYSSGSSEDFEEILGDDDLPF